MKEDRRRPAPRRIIETVRLNRYIASSGVCSRREADELIRTGKVHVNDKVVDEMGVQVDPRKDQIRVNGKVIRNEKKVYILLNKPKDTITTTDDPEKRKTVMGLIRNATDLRVYPVGRLDRNTTGVLLLTNDGDLAARLTHPSHGVKKIYHVTLNKNLIETDMDLMVKGFDLDDGPMHADAIALLDPNNKKDLGVEIHSGRNRIIRRMFEHLGYEIIKLDRVYFGGLTKKNIAKGKWRYLSEKEVGWLKMGRYGA